MNDSRFLSFRRHEKTNQIHIHFHIFAFPPIHQLTHIASNCAPDAPKTAWRRAASHVPTQLAIRGDAAPTASGCNWRYIATKRGMRGGMHGILDKEARDSGQGCT